MGSSFEHRAFDFVDAVERISTPAELAKAFHFELAILGVESWLITGLPLAGEAIDPLIRLSGWPAGWTALYTREGWVHVDAVAIHCHRTLKPFEWSEAPVDQRIAAVSARIMGLAADHRMVRGLCVPVRGERGLQAVVTMAGIDPDFDSRIRTGLHLIAIYAHERALRFADASQLRPVLSPRQREIVRWAAAGKTAWEIGEILSISETTVRTHMLQAGQRLGVTGWTAVAATALARGEASL